jgi:hypothetical protein
MIFCVDTKTTPGIAHLFFPEDIWETPTNNNPWELNEMLRNAYPQRNNHYISAVGCYSGYENCVNMRVL